MTEYKYGSDYPITFRKVHPGDIEMLRDFDCGNSSINEFIREKSLDTRGKVTYVFIDGENKKVICFCAICCTAISINATDGKNKFRTGMPTIEIDFFAVDERYRSLPFDRESNRYETLSNALFSYMIKLINEISVEHVGATHICLYAVPKAVNFYKRCGFEEFEEYMNRDEKPYIDGCVPMFLSMA